MKFLIALALILSSFAARADEWTMGQKIGGGVLLAEFVVDYGQSRWIVKNCNITLNCTGNYEANPLLKHASIGRVNTYFALAPLVTYALADNLSSENRSGLIWGLAAFELVVIGHNKYIGYHVQY